MEDITISEHFLRAALSGAQAKGFDTKAMLLKANISPDVLSEKKARVTGKQYTRLMQALWNDMQDEFMGFYKHRSKPGTFATMCQLVIHSANLESVFRRGTQFYSLFEKPISLELSVVDNQASLIIRSEEELNDPMHFLQESLLVIWHRLCCWLIGTHIILDEASFTYSSPEHVGEYRHLFHCPLHFCQDVTAIRFSTRYLQMPVLRDEIELRKFLRTSPADLLAKPDDSNSFTARIRKIIGRDLSADMPDFEAVSSLLNVSPQTLRRRLKDENTSYQEIKDNLRRDMSIYHLCRREYTINEIAILVGFTEPSTFHRAFKKWTGLTPGAYREGERPEIEIS
ncbi:MAG: AraC family transcriptional regulator [Hahellaceae bacterium]|jgi:AraC-like DNA-binding protein|nr:AraC family transcriptional regulator [Hahellaceae bacterium]MCP5213157.1 AraC family transcriptional regulator [Hahellaceae bacterium]